MSATVLVTAIGTVTATSVVRELRRVGSFHIIGADINKQYEVATSLDVDEYYRFPLVTEEGYLSFVIDFCREHGVDYYYAVLDKEVVKISESRAAFERVGTKLCVPNYEFVCACHFKDEFGRWVALEMPEIAIRQYESFTESLAAEYPLFVKPVEGVASAGCRRVDSPDELKACIRPHQVGRDYVVQDFVSGVNITVDYVRNAATGQRMQVQRRELLRNANGCGIAVEIFYDSSLASICDRLAEGLELNGVCNMEFFDTGDGYRVIEINPRLSAGSAFSCMAGLNTVIAAMDIAEGRPCVFGEIETGAHFAERYEPYRMD